uniref:Uncharacterized protein n=1 Tax=Oryza meridionalis TaxID=40149 RepID=A0A0E0EQB5_9ORYZ
MEAPFEQLLDRLQLVEEETAAPVAAFVADFYVPWVVGVGNRRGMPVYSLYPMAAVFFSAYNHFDSLSSTIRTRGAAPCRLLPPAFGAGTDVGGGCLLFKV